MLIFGEAELQGRNGVTVRAFPILDGEARVGTFWHVQADDAQADPLGMLEMGKCTTVGTMRKSAALGFADRRRTHPAFNRGPLSSDFSARPDAAARGFAEDERQ